jgi:hypothetical protein
LKWGLFFNQKCLPTVLPVFSAVVEEKRVCAEIGWIGESGDKELAEVKDRHDHDVDPEGTERR